MHDIRTIRENPAAFDAPLARRNHVPMSYLLLGLDSERRASINAAEGAKAAINALSRKAGAAKANGDEAEFDKRRSEVAQAKADSEGYLALADRLDGDLRDARQGR